MLGSEGLRDRANSIVCLLVVLLLAGCGGARGPERWKSLQPEQRAVVFGTTIVEEDGMGLTRSVLHFRNVDTREEGAIETSPGFDQSGHPDLYERRKRIGWFFELAMPPGRYEFFRYFAVRSMGQFGSTQFHSKEDFSVPFTVEAGRTYYFGQFRAVGFIGRNIFGIPLAEGGYFIVSDEQARDTARLAKQRQAPIAEPIINMDLNPGPESFFLRRSPHRPDDKPPTDAMKSS